jgi:hypothetical protein
MHIILWHQGCASRAGPYTGKQLPDTLGTRQVPQLGEISVYVLTDSGSEFNQSEASYMKGFV